MKTSVLPLVFSAISILAMSSSAMTEKNEEPSNPASTDPVSSEITPGGLAGKPWGYYTGKIQLEFDRDGRKMIVLNEVKYTDSHGFSWIAPSKAKVDGASIPQAFWTFVGGPFEGRYRDASVFHDVACETRLRTWQRTHLMFYEAMRCSGVSENKAKLMYFAVSKFGPRWKPRKRGMPTPAKYLPTTATPPSKAEVERIQAWIDRKNPSLEELATTVTTNGR